MKTGNYLVSNNIFCVCKLSVILAQEFLLFSLSLADLWLVVSISLLWKFLLCEILTGIPFGPGAPRSPCNQYHLS